MVEQSGSSDEVQRLTVDALNELAASAAKSAAPVFAANGWKWATVGGVVPDAPQLALRIRRMLADVEEGHELSSGRISASRYVEDGVEYADVFLQLEQRTALTRVQEDADAQSSPLPGDPDEAY